MYFPKGTKKDDAPGDLRAPLRYRTPGIMVHMPASSAQHGELLKSHFVDPEKKNGCRIKMLEADVFAQIAALLKAGAKFWPQQHLASPRTGELPKASLGEQGVCLAP